MKSNSYLHVILSWSAAVGVDSPEIEKRLARFTDAARKGGVKLTHQRLEIFREVASSIEHPPVEAVFRAVRKRIPTVSLDTVYRTLWMLEDLGVVTTLGPRRGTVRFDANLRPHHHFVCVRCGLARDFENAAFDALSVPGGVEEYGDVLGARVELRGVCRRCSRKGAARSPRRPASDHNRDKEKRK
jgi:Fur family peroxide stress response transcriptional regulator